MKAIVFFVALLTLVSCQSVSDNISSEMYNIGNAYYDMGEYDKAIEYYLRALEDNVDNQNSVRYNLAVAYTESGRIQEGLNHFDILLQQDSVNLKILQSIAYSYYLLGNLEESLRVYNEILEYFEFDKIALFNKAVILMEDDKEEAGKVLEKLYSVDVSVDVVLLLGAIYSEREEWDLYAEKFELALIDNQENLDLLSGLAEYYKRFDQYDKYFLFLDKLLGLEEPDKLADLYFSKAEIELLNIKDLNAGLLSLKNAVDNGFEDKNKIESLLENEDLIQFDQIQSFFASKGLID